MESSECGWHHDYTPTSLFSVGALGCSLGHVWVRHFLIGILLGILKSKGCLLTLPHHGGSPGWVQTLPMQSPGILVSLPTSGLTLSWEPLGFLSWHLHGNEICKAFASPWCWCLVFSGGEGRCEERLHSQVVHRELAAGPGLPRAAALGASLYVLPDALLFMLPVLVQAALSGCVSSCVDSFSIYGKSSIR